MSIEEILVILQNRIAVLNEARKHAVNSGNLDQVISVDADLLSTQTSIDQIKTTV